MKLMEDQDRIKLFLVVNIKIILISNSYKITSVYLHTSTNVFWVGAGHIDLLASQPLYYDGGVDHFCRDPYILLELLCVGSTSH